MIIKMLVKKEYKICEGVNFTCIPSKKFKTVKLSFTMFTPLDAETVSKNAIIPELLITACKKYPSVLSINKCLDNLYGANISSGVDKYGDTQVLTVSSSCINSELAFDSHDDILFEIADLLCEVVFNPFVDEDGFIEKNVSQQKRQLIEIIESELNDKISYAKHRCEQLMCKDEKFGINKYGTVEDVEKITGKDMLITWQNLLKTSRIEIMAIGNADSELIKKIFEKRFSDIERKGIVKCKTEIIRKASEVKTYNDKMEVVQCKLVMGFRTNCAGDDTDVSATRLMTALLGGTPNSKLFLNVREKLSLCYYCAARYNKQKGIMLIESGVEAANIEKAKESILNQIEDVKAGNFSKDDVNAAKMYLSQSFKKINDSLSSLDDWYILQTFSKHTKSPEEVIEEINKVTDDEIINAAGKLSLDTIYVLSTKND
jgi:predicted Zn-dependent peptidase